MTSLTSLTPVASLIFLKAFSKISILIVIVIVIVIVMMMMMMMVPVSCCYFLRVECLLRGLAVERAAVIVR